MKKIIVGSLLLLLVGCNDISAPVPTSTTIPSPSPTTTPSIYDTEETTPHPSAPIPSTSPVLSGNFKKVNVNGIFDIYIADPLPEQMTFETRDWTGRVSEIDSSQPCGSFGFHIESNDPSCSDRGPYDPRNEVCKFDLYWYDYSTSDIPGVSISAGPLYIDDADFNIDSSQFGTIYFWRSPLEMTAQIETRAPDYYYSDWFNRIEYWGDELFHF